MKRDLLQQAYGAMRHDMRKTILTMLGWPGALPRLCFFSRMVKGSGTPSTTYLRVTATAPSAFLPDVPRNRQAATKRACLSGLPTKMLNCCTMSCPWSDTFRVNPICPATVQSGSRSFSFTTFGVDPSVETIWNLDVDDGRFINDQDNNSHAHLAVLGSEAKDKLFSGMPALGREHSRERRFISGGRCSASSHAGRRTTTSTASSISPSTPWTSLQNNTIWAASGLIRRARPRKLYQDDSQSLGLNMVSSPMTNERFSSSTRKSSSPSSALSLWG